MLAGIPDRKIRVLVIWQPILLTDWARPGAGVLARVRDPRARQFWDPDNRFPRRLGARIRSDPNHAQPRCCWRDDIPWDLVALYPAGARWERNLPAAVFIDGPVFSVTAALTTSLSSRSASIETWEPLARPEG